MNIGDWPNPDGWLDILDHVVVAAFMLLVAVVPTYMTIRGNRGIRDIKNQVVNGHKDAPPLRADLDRALKAISVLGEELSSFRSQITRDVAHIRSELADEEERRRSHISEVRSEYDRKLTSLHNRLEDR